MRRSLSCWLVWGFASVLGSGLTGCFILRCDETFHGIDGQRTFTSTIIGPYAEGSSGRSCGALGDLPAGTELIWTGEPTGPGDGCDDHLRMNVSQLSTGSVQGSVLTLPNGGSGTWLVSAYPLSDDADFLANDPEQPRWYIERQFQSPSGACFPDSPAMSGSCSDRFIATSTN